MVIGLLVGAVWIGVLTLVVGLCRVSARAETTEATPLGSAYTDTRTILEVAQALAPAPSTRRAMGKPARRGSLRGLAS